ncbi:MULTISPECIES: hypothetical protein [unclassified Sphingobacterium]|jgi:predicted Holliday junction resolvase-like endonuclease|uniref:hypothetical protein n=1 Tax=unclassified Sphingobacterium TaxID=2609468 RepID=UPI00104493BA|nr:MULTISPECIES: hypothetical protein [unclassified Sphingobacterium]MCS3556600.1 putative Holliday junction resolvase-like endonuclease [Sphingobacterium sp. JUb21]TCQ99893.1 hypothetical protein EDF66_113118 [Sphingobacterium sp. JUb20]
MIENLIPIIFTLVLIIIIYVNNIKSRSLQDKKETARKELEHKRRQEIENKVIDSMAAIMKDRVLFTQKIMASEGTNSLKISEDIKDIIADEVICFLENLEPDVTQSLRSLFADQARMKKMLIKELKRNYCINNNNFFCTRVYAK